MKIIERHENQRLWMWTPPPVMNTVMSTILRMPVLHRFMSGMILLITFTGRKSGKRYTTPVGYIREADTVTILSKRFRTWWQNFRESASVIVRIERKNMAGQASVLTEVEQIIPIIAHVVAVHPREAEIYGIKLQPDGQPDMESIREIAPKLVVIQVHLMEEQFKSQMISPFWAWHAKPLQQICGDDHLPFKAFLHQLMPHHINEGCA